MRPHVLLLLLVSTGLWGVKESHAATRLPQPGPRCKAVLPTSCRHERFKNRASCVPARVRDLLATRRASAAGGRRVDEAVWHESTQTARRYVLYELMSLQL
jgi:hypothetical protein